MTSIIAHDSMTWRMLERILCTVFLVTPKFPQLVMLITTDSHSTSDSFCNPTDICPIAQARSIIHQNGVNNNGRKSKATHPRTRSKVSDHLVGQHKSASHTLRTGTCLTLLHQTSMQPGRGQTLCNYAPCLEYPKDKSLFAIPEFPPSIDE